MQHTAAHSSTQQHTAQQSKAEQAPRQRRQTATTHAANTDTALAARADTAMLGLARRCAAVLTGTCRVLCTTVLGEDDKTVVWSAFGAPRTVVPTTRVMAVAATTPHTGDGTHGLGEQPNTRRPRRVLDPPRATHPCTTTAANKQGTHAGHYHRPTTPHLNANTAPTTHNNQGHTNTHNTEGMLP